MAGIYFHIPFCKTRCIYCDFFSSSNQSKKKEYIEAMCRELADRKDYLKGQAIETIYFGGGTPSQLSAEDFEKIFGTLEEHLDDKEITLEANPDDITPLYLDSIQHLPFNRISLGVQSFNDSELQFLNRRHNAQAAIQAVKLCQEYGYKNISIDLIYGLPNQSLTIWQENIQQAIRLNIQHVSAYHLTYEPDTKLFDLWENQKIQAIDENLSIQMFEVLIDTLTEAGFRQYEISNFAQPSFESKHNSAYWKGVHYLGIGSSAHSYNGISRQWNSKSEEYHTFQPEIEMIDEKMAYNDFVITRMRTMKGINLDELQSLFGEETKAHFLLEAQKHILNQSLELTDNHIRLTRKGIFISDGVMSDLMLFSAQHKREITIDNVNRNEHK